MKAEARTSRVLVVTLNEEEARQVHSDLNEYARLISNAASRVEQVTDATADLIAELHDFQGPVEH